jgi:hypothetical protein
MGFVNIGGHTVHTSALSGSIGVTGSSGSIGVSGYTSNSTLTTTGSAYSTYTTLSQKTTYHLLGEDISIDGYSDVNVAQTIALINCIGWKYYEEIQKQGVSFSGELKVILEQRYKTHTRDQKINNILETKS